MSDPDCNHEWVEQDSLFTNEYFADVKCARCGERGQRDESGGSVFYPAT